MNGRTHAAIGATVTPLSAVTVGLEPSEIFCLVVVAAGFSLGPDIDHPKATISQASPRFLCVVFRGLSGVALRLSSTASDQRHIANASDRGIDTTHRTLTHTVLFSGVIGAFAYFTALTSFGSALMVFFSAMACRALLGKKDRNKNFGPRSLMTVIALGAATMVFFVGVPAEYLALAAWLGWFSHIIADCCTRAGVPALWPLKIRGRRWWRLRLLGSWLKSGDTGEWVAAAGIVVPLNLVQMMLLSGIS